MSRKRLDTETCPSPQELEAHAAGRLIGRRNEEVFLHLKHCGKCLRTLAGITRVPSPEEIVRGSRRGSLWQRFRSRRKRR